MPMKFCRRCGGLTTGAAYHESCRKIVDNARYARRGTTAERGLSGEHQRFAEWIKVHKPPCACRGECGRTHFRVCGYPYGDPNNKITVGHIVDRQHGGTSDWSNLRPECEKCQKNKNRRKK